MGVNDADYLLGVSRRTILKCGPIGLRLSEPKAGRFRLMAFAESSAPDHVDQLHSLPVWIGWMWRVPPTYPWLRRR